MAESNISLYIPVRDVHDKHGATDWSVLPVPTLRRGSASGGVFLLVVDKDSLNAPLPGNPSPRQLQYIVQVRVSTIVFGLTAWVSLKLVHETMTW